MRATESSMLNVVAPAYGGFSEVARRLSDAGPRAVSRQGVYAWWTRRVRNGFPDHHHLNDDGWKEWRIVDVIDWYADYTAPPESHWGRRSRDEEEEGDHAGWKDGSSHQIPT